MRRFWPFGLLLSLGLLAPRPAAAQMMFNMPSVRGVWTPTVGSGAAYEMDGPKGKMQVEISILSKEAVNGKDGYWMEVSMNPEGQQVYVKELISVDGGSASVSRLIMQMGPQPPMEMPVNMTRMNQQAPADIRQDAQLVGTEDVTTAAGTFNCQHYKGKDGDGWVSSKVTPWSLVKMTSKDQTITLQRVITSATPHITATPQKFDPSLLMGQRPGQPPPR